MTTRGYTLLGWIVWRVVRWVVRRKVAQNRAKLAAGATVLLVVVAGFAAARSGATGE